VIKKGTALSTEPNDALVLVHDDAEIPPSSETRFDYGPQLPVREERDGIGHAEEDSREEGEARKATEATEAREAREARDMKKAREAREATEAREAREAKEAREASKAREEREAREAREAKEATDARMSREARMLREARVARETKEACEADVEEMRPSTSRSVQGAVRDPAAMASAIGEKQGKSRVDSAHQAFLIWATMASASSSTTKVPSPTSITTSTTDPTATITTITIASPTKPTIFSSTSTTMSNNRMLRPKTGLEVGDKNGTIICSILTLCYPNYKSSTLNELSVLTIYWLRTSTIITLYYR
jgi:sensor c-di-GMP phosphodiesterase-like protein